MIAWRLFWLTHINRQNPQASCATILAEAEWQALYCRVNKTAELPKQPPTVRQAVRWIARLGGFLGRKRGSHEFEFSIPYPSEYTEWLDRQIEEFKKSGADMEGLLKRQLAQYEEAWKRFAQRFPKMAKRIGNKLGKKESKNF